MRRTNINQYLYWIILTNYRLILTNNWLRMTKTEYVKYEIVSVNIGYTSVKYQLTGLVKHRLILVNFFMRVSIGRNVHKQKQYVLCNLSELYRAFRDKYPSWKIGFSKFFTLRPKWFVLLLDHQALILFAYM